MAILVQVSGYYRPTRDHSPECLKFFFIDKIRSSLRRDRQGLTHRDATSQQEAHGAGEVCHIIVSYDLPDYRQFEKELVEIEVNSRAFLESDDEGTAKKKKNAEGEKAPWAEKFTYGYDPPRGLSPF